MCANGHGVPQDHAEAVKWFQLSAEQGFAGAQASLGVTYLEGLGLPQDDVQALMWFNLAASRFPPGEDHDRAVQDRDTVAKRMTPAQITEAQKLAREWRPRGEQPE
jgi:TPR repeat protein